ncbi:hypothetical protein [Streptomyces longwoodensis]|uniref:hypothetical protein n=1 Tax=Streptomyces longwoodensis TaxID=68231 RepID=UPI00324A6C00
MRALARLGDIRAVPSLLAALDSDDDAWRAVEVADHLPQEGHVEKHLGQTLNRAAGAPLFAFLDPFGLGLSFETLTQQIFGSRSVHGTTGRHATEVLLNFNANAVRRIGGLLTSPKDTPGKPATLRAMDAACGGSWWREEFLVASQDNTEAVRRITTGFADRVARAAVEDRRHSRSYAAASAGCQPGDGSRLARSWVQPQRVPAGRLAQRQAGRAAGPRGRAAGRPAQTARRSSPAFPPPGDRDGAAKDPRNGLPTRWLYVTVRPGPEVDHRRPVDVDMSAASRGSTAEVTK